MKKTWIVICAFLSLIGITSSLYANEDHNAAEHVIRRAYTSIASIEEGKLFLMPDKLCLKQGVIYVEDLDGACNCIS